MWTFPRRPEPGLSEAEKAAHPSWRRWTRRYAAKKRLVRTVWIVAGLLMLALPFPAQFAVALPTALLSFVILDETR